MKPLAIFYACISPEKKVALFFTVISDFPKDLEECDEEDQLPTPFKLGPFQFGKNRISIVTFGKVEIKVVRNRDKDDVLKSTRRKSMCAPAVVREGRHRAQSVYCDIDWQNSLHHFHPIPDRHGIRPECKEQWAITNSENQNWFFELSNGVETVILNDRNPLCFFSVSDNVFEIAASPFHRRVQQLSDLVMLAGDIMINIDSNLDWISEDSLKHDFLYQLSSSNMWWITPTEVVALLEPLAPLIPKLLEHDPEERNERGTFQTNLDRIQIDFAILAKALLHVVLPDFGSRQRCSLNGDIVYCSSHYPNPDISYPTSHFSDSTRSDPNWNERDKVSASTSERDSPQTGNARTQTYRSSDSLAERSHFGNDIEAHNLPPSTDHQTEKTATLHSNDEEENTDVPLTSPRVVLWSLGRTYTWLDPPTPMVSIKDKFAFAQPVGEDRYYSCEPHLKN